MPVINSPQASLGFPDTARRLAWGLAYVDFSGIYIYSPFLHIFFFLQEK